MLLGGTILSLLLLLLFPPLLGLSTVPPIIILPHELFDHHIFLNITPCNKPPEILHLLFSLEFVSEELTLLIVIKFVFP